VIGRLGRRPVRYAQSHQNDPLGAAVALEVIRTIAEEALIERSQPIAATLAGGLDKIKAQTNRVAAIRARGLMAALELEDDAKAAYTGHVQKTLVENGFILAQRPGLNVLRIDPSLTIEAADIENFLAVLRDVLANP
jgi:acetylornithine aminotransferase